MAAFARCADQGVLVLSASCAPSLWFFGTPLAELPATGRRSLVVEGLAHGAGMPASAAGGAVAASVQRRGDACRGRALAVEIPQLAPGGFTDRGLRRPAPRLGCDVAAPKRLLGEGIERLRSAQQVALAEAAAELTKRPRLGECLDAFGDHCDVELVAQCSDRRDQ